MAAALRYNQEYHDVWAWSLATKGATDREIADAFGIAVRTLHRWKKDHMSLRKKLDEGKAGVNARVETSLYKRAIGYEYEETESVLEMDKDGNQKPLRVKKTKKHVAPDTMAAIYWLNNRTRKTGDWTQKQDVSVSFEENRDVVIYLPEKEQDEGDNAGGDA